MPDSNKFLTLLATLPPARQRAFGRFLDGEYPGFGRELAAAYHALGHPPQEPDPETLYAAIFPEREFREVRVRRLYSDLTAALYEFLAQEEIREQPTERMLLGLRHLQQVDLEKHRRSQFRNLRRTLDHSPLRNADHALQEYRFATFRDRHDPTEQDAYRNTDHHLEVFYLSNKLRLFCETAALARAHPDRPVPTLAPGLLARAADYTEAAVVAYRSLVLLYLEPDRVEHFHRYKTFLHQHIRRFDHYEQQNLFVHALNYCIDTKINLGRNDFFEELFELYRDALETGILLRHGHLPPEHYKNIITGGMRAGRLQWIEAFIQTHTDRLPPEHRADAEAYNLAKLYFHRNDHDRVLEQLRAVTDRNDRYAFGSKILLLKTYFQLGEDRSLQSLLESFRLYVRRHPRLSAPVRRRYLSFLKIFKRLVRLNPYERAEWAQFRTAVVEEEGLLEREWFLGILEERAGSRE